MIDKVIKVLKSIDFSTIRTPKGKDIGLFRVRTSTGCVEFVRLVKNNKYEPHIHDKTDAEIFILRGKGIALIGNKAIEYPKQKKHFLIPAGSPHGFYTQDETILLSIQNKPILQNQKLDFRYAQENFKRKPKK